MAGDAQKTPLVQTQPEFASRLIGDAVHQMGRALPCRVSAVSGQIVTVAFQVSDALLPSVTIPIAAWAYDWIPVQVGDVGVTMPADARLGGISGLGGGAADLIQPGNLTALVFVPCAVKSWSVPDATQRVVQGPGGVLVRTSSGACSIDVTPTGISITVPAGKTVTVNGNGGTVNVSDSSVIITSGDVTADGVSLKNHVHSGVQSGGADTGPPVA